MREADLGLMWVDCRWVESGWKGRDDAIIFQGNKYGVEQPSNLFFHLFFNCVFLINQHDTQVLYFRVFCCVSLNKKNESAQITYISSTTIRWKYRKLKMDFSLTQSSVQNASKCWLNSRFYSKNNIINTVFHIIQSSHMSLS